MDPIIAMIDNEGMWMAWGRIASHGTTSVDRLQIPANASDKVRAGDLAGITSAGVDHVWTAMYESNQRTKNHNKKILKIRFG